MLLNDIYYEAGEIEARALRRPSLAKPYAAKAPAVSRGPRRLLGHALIGLGRLIAAESSPSTAQLRAGR
jgi:hypothetical protein